jgi:hypothetical protein
LFTKRILLNFDPDTIFELGKAIPNNAEFPPGVDSIEAGFRLIDMAYNMNFEGYVGFYKMIEHDQENKRL